MRQEVTMSEADLILRPDGSVYHLALLPEDIAPTVITVGDPGRVARVSQHFDSIQVEKSQREFLCHTGYLGQKRISVISTGMGTSNIEIVMHELDALVNIDLDTRTPKKELTSLNIIRLGTSGTIDPGLSVGTLVLSELAFAADGLHHYYPVITENTHKLQKSQIWHDHCYLTSYSESLADEVDLGVKKVVTYTAQGFYGPQFRNTRTQNKSQYHHALHDLGVHNIEMETAGIYLLAHHLGHRALSYSCLLANRATGRFSTDPGKQVDQMIENVLQALG